MATKADVVALTGGVLRDLSWRALQPAMPQRDLARMARGEAEDRLAAEQARATVPHIVRVPVSDSMVANERGHALARQHGPLLIALADVLDGLDAVIQDSKLGAMPEDQLRALAEQHANEYVARKEARGQSHKARADRLEAAGLPPDAPFELTPDDLRRMDPLWHRRQLRTRAGTSRQHLAAALRTVGRGAAPYADDYSVSRYRERQQSATAWAAGRVWQPEGKAAAVPMASIMAGKVQAAIARLVCVGNGVDDLAAWKGLVPIWITITLPLNCHPNPKQGRNTWLKDLSPTLTDLRLRQLWYRFKMRLRKSRVQRLGTRVWEGPRGRMPARPCLALCHARRHSGG